MGKKALRIGLIGLGRWGRNYLKVLSKLPGVELIHVAARPNQKPDNKDFPNVLFSENWLEVCHDIFLDGIIVATPPHTHYDITRLAIALKLPVLVEKPFTICPKQTMALHKLSLDSGVLCMVNYIHLFSPAYRDLKSSIAKSGNIENIFSEGFSLGPYRNNVSVLWDWGSHELAMCIDLLQEAPESIQLSEVFKSTANPFAKLLMLKMAFPSKTKARCIFGNAAEFKRRDFFVVCEDGCFLYDGLSEGLSKQFSERVFSCDSQRFNVQQTPLECAVLEFLDYVKANKRSHYTLELAAKVNQSLDLLNRS